MGEQDPAMMPPYLPKEQKPKAAGGWGLGEKLGELGEAGGASSAAENEPLSSVTSGSGSACRAR